MPLRIRIYVAAIANLLSPPVFSVNLVPNQTSLRRTRQFIMLFKPALYMHDLCEIPRILARERLEETAKGSTQRCRRFRISGEDRHDSKRRVMFVYHQGFA